MRAFANQRSLIELQRVAFDDLQAIGERLAKLFERRNAAAIAFHCHDASARVEQRVGQATGSGTDFKNPLAVERPGDRRHPR